MKNYAVIIDSTTYLTDEEVKSNNITKVSLNLMVENVTYKELEISNDFVFKNIDDGISVTTSQPSPGEFLHAYEDLFNKGYKNIFVITISDELSGTYQSAILGKKMLDNPDNVTVFNSKTAAFGTEILALELGKMVKENQELSNILKHMDQLINHSELIFTIENLSSLIKSGRLSKTKGLISTVMKIKPIIRVVNGKLELVKAARTHKKVFGYILENMRLTINDYKKLHFRIMNVKSDQNAKALEEMVMDAFPDATLTINYYIGPTFSTHLGKQGYGISWTTE